MRQSRWTPTIVPNAGDPNVYLVLDCVEQSECAWREADAGKTDLEQRVIAFNTFEHWAADVSEEIRRCADAALEDLSSSIEDFVVRHAGREQQLNLRLA